MKRNKNLQISYLTIRKILGVLGILLPLLLWAGSLMSGYTSVRISISSYYFTNSRDLLVGTLCTLAIFLISYKGYDALDDLVSSLAGICALLIAVFPACTESGQEAEYLFKILDTLTVTVIHFVSAALFFLLLAIMSFFLFTKTGSKVMSRRKHARNALYRLCAGFIVAAMVGMGIVDLLPKDNPVKALNPVFWLETVALVAFGLSWLAKGEWLLADR